MTKSLATIMFTSVVSRETIRIALMMTALKDLVVKSGDFLNANVHAAVTENVRTILGPEFGKDAGKTVGIARAL